MRTRSVAGGSADATTLRVSNILNLLESRRLGKVDGSFVRYISTEIDLHRRFSNANPVLRIMDHLGNYWHNGILVVLKAGPCRPSTIAKLVSAFDEKRPISQRMLHLSLNQLVQDGLITRSLLSEKPLHVEYKLSPLGDQLVDRFLLFLEWIFDHAQEIVDAGQTLAEEAHR